MKKFLVVFFVAMALCLISTLALAEDFQWASGYRTITQIYPDSDFQFYLDGTTIDPNSSCANRFVIWNSDSNYEVQVASLLIAFQNGYQVLVKYDNDNTGCATNVDMIKIQIE